MTHLYHPSFLERTAGSAWMKSDYWQIMDLVGQAIGISLLGKEKCFRESKTMKLPPLVKGSTLPLAAIQPMGNNAAGSPVTLSLHLETSMNGISVIWAGEESGLILPSNHLASCLIFTSWMECGNGNPWHHARSEKWGRASWLNSLSLFLN